MNATLNMVTWIFLASLFSVSGYLYLKDKKAAEKSLSKGAGIKEIMSFSATPSVAALLKFFIAVLCLWAAGQIGYAFIGKTTFSTGIAGTAVAVDGIGSAVKSGASWVGDAVSGFSTEPVGVQDVLELVEEKSLISVDVSGAPISGGNAAVAPSAPVAAPAAP